MFKNVVEIQIKSSYQNLTDTAEVTIPRKLSFNRKPIASDGGVFKRGDKITIRAAYDFENRVIFSGYLVSIKPGTPIVVQCEDEMFNLKKGAISKAYPVETDLQEVIKDQIPAYPSNAVKVELGKFRIVKETLAQLLERLRKEYVTKSFFVTVCYTPDSRFGRSSSKTQRRGLHSIGILSSTILPIKQRRT